MVRGRFVVAVVGLVVAVAACSSGSSAAPERVRSVADPDVMVLMDPTAPPAQTAAVRHAIRDSDDVARYSFTSHAGAYREMKKFEIGSDLASVIRPSDLPESFGIALDDGARWRPLAARLDRMPGVQTVGHPKSSRRRACRDLRTRIPKSPAWLKQVCTDARDSL